MCVCMEKVSVNVLRSRASLSLFGSVVYTPTLCIIKCL